jgi:hypothetical protein
VRHVAGLEDEVTRSADVDLIPNQDADLALKYVGILVLAPVRVVALGGRGSI